MKIGMFMIVWTTQVTSEHEPIIKDLAETGYDGIEVPLFAGTTEDYKAVGKMLDQYNMGSTAVAVIPDESCSPVGPEASQRRAAVEHLSRCIECAAAMGSDAIGGPLAQPLGHFTNEPPTEDERKRAAEVHHEVAEVAAKHNITLCVEPINRFENYMITTMDQAADAVRRVDHPNFQAMYDSFHANIEERDPLDAIRRHGDILKHVHVSENDRGIPGRGHIDFDGLFRTLHEVNYDGWLTIEAFGRVNQEIIAATRVWRDLYDDPVRLYTEGYRTIHDGWQRTAK
jgi:D-psicose/D-tagatose/L-ribulose 3-epimerase